MAGKFSYQFSTKPVDAETWFSYYGYRFYSPALGRWISRDPIEEDGVINLYQHCHNISLSYYDYLGLDPKFIDRSGDLIYRDDRSIHRGGDEPTFRNDHSPPIKNSGSRHYKHGFNTFLPEWEDYLYFWMRMASHFTATRSQGSPVGPSACDEANGYYLRTFKITSIP